MARVTGCSPPDLFRRGGVWWWRRRLPRLPGAHPPLHPGVLQSDPARRAARPTLALTLRTACREEGCRRGARLAVRFDDAVASRGARMDGPPDQQAAFARDLPALKQAGSLKA